MRTAKIVLGTAAAAAAVLGGAGCTAQQMAQARQATTAASASASPAASTPSAPTSGPVGTTFTDTGDNGADGATTTYDVTLTRVVENAGLTQFESVENPGDHVVGAEFTVAGTAGDSSDDADSDAVVVGTDGQEYTPSFDDITEGTNFNDGDFNLTPGARVSGWVAFELPAGVSVATVQWAPAASANTATWTVGK